MSQILWKRILLHPFNNYLGELYQPVEYYSDGSEKYSLNDYFVDKPKTSKGCLTVR